MKTVVRPNVFLLALPLLLIHYFDDSFCADGDVAVRVDTPVGQFKGMKVTAVNNKHYIAFTNIPYALPPVGELRFAKPKPHPRLEGLFDAREPIRKCFVAELFLNGEEQGTEDCLILNIYLSDLRLKSEQKKVVVYFHGGGFSLGSSVMYNPGSFVTTQDIIVVTINYRLGVLGFLSTENKASPGNYGLWDQTLALKWVKDNIAAFGGDPGDVTIAGESAGGVSVSILSLSPVTKNLFTKAYAHSGTATGYCYHCNTPRQDALIVAQSVGCWEEEVNKDISVEEGHAIIQCLRTRPAHEIQVTLGFGIDKLSFVPVVDRDFIPDLPGKLLMDRNYLESVGFFKKSHLLGLNSNEGSFTQLLVDVAKHQLNSNNEMSSGDREKTWNRKLDDAYAKLLKCRLTANDVSEAVKTKMVSWYENKYGEKSFPVFFDDNFFTLPTFDVVESLARNKSKNAWLLYFSHDPQFIKGPQRGMIHGLDIAYWFDISLDTMELLLQQGIVNDFSDEDGEVKRLFSSVIAEFIKSGKPGDLLKSQLKIDWPAYDLQNEWYLSLNLNSSIKQHLDKEKREMWNNWGRIYSEEKIHHTEL